MPEVFFEDEEAQENEESESEKVCGHESEYSDATNASSGSDEDMENATLDKLLLESRARGRPSSTSKGKDGFKWKTKFPERRSGDAARGKWKMQEFVIQGLKEA
ncbi:hypothetical protein HHI36_022210 [Cryptolaemus montrouzieri]|uniref:Uncharacterized protein n=1 Tax=Cryptolaemus montrouzieri TaxID=559131 RepID=A0ABD2MZ50_9CUCU